MNIIEKADAFVAVNEGGQEMGRLEFEPAGAGRIAATHTKVNPESQGEGVGGKLLAALVDYARKHKVKIKPVCAFVAGSFKKHPELYKDVALAD